MSISIGIFQFQADLSLKRPGERNVPPVPVRALSPSAPTCDRINFANLAASQ
jgi:hypothetical protein